MVKYYFSQLYKKNTIFAGKETHLRKEENSNKHYLTI